LPSITWQPLFNTWKLNPQENPNGQAERWHAYTGVQDFTDEIRSAVLLQQALQKVEVLEVLLLWAWVLSGQQRRDKH
jgi:hypothetical protein